MRIYLPWGVVFAAYLPPPLSISCALECSRHCYRKRWIGRTKATTTTKNKAKNQSSAVLLVKIPPAKISTKWGEMCVRACAPPVFLLLIADKPCDGAEPSRGGSGVPNRKSNRAGGGVIKSKDDKLHLGISAPPPKRFDTTTRQRASFARSSKSSHLICTSHRVISYAHNPPSHISRKSK